MKHFLLTLILVAACAPQPPAQIITPTSERETTATPSATLTATPRLAPTQTQEPATVAVRFWLPDTLAGLDSVEAGDVLAEQISGFEAANPALDVELRLRAAEGAGGVLEALRTATTVAPAALPDITLLRYPEFLQAVEQGLIARLDPSEVPPLDETYAPSVAAMAQVDGALYGIPSTIDLLHVSAPADSAFPASWRFDDLLDAQFTFLFPAAPPDGIADVFLLQYLTAGAAEVSQETLVLDEGALRATLRFYERAVADDLVPVEVLEYDIPDRYAASLGADMPLVVNSHMVLQALRQGQPLGYGYVPTVTGEPVTFGDGWLWVITTNDSGRQAAALRFMTWMLATERQSAYHSTIDRLPAATAAQRQVDAEYAAFIEPLLAAMRIPPATYRQSTLARALQNAYATVISGQSSANDALEAVLAQMGQ